MDYVCVMELSDNLFSKGLREKNNTLSNKLMDISEEFRVLSHELFRNYLRSLSGV